jgi:TetR/AcrR family transcriptional regulator, regulator of cefoperazone and chloramphenicol sensitivity
LMESYNGKLKFYCCGMPTPLEKARKDPGSMKARILTSSRDLFAEYGYHGVTTRMIAKDVGIDISTLHYHWGDKENLFEAVVEDLNDEIEMKLKEVEKLVRGKSLAYRLEVAIDVMCDYLFQHPSVAKLVMFSHFIKTRTPGETNQRLFEQVSNIAIAMGLAPDKDGISTTANARVLAVSNAIYSFTAGKSFMQSILKVDEKEYDRVIRETLKFILIPAFTRENES